MVLTFLVFALARSNKREGEKNGPSFMGQFRHEVLQWWIARTPRHHLNLPTENGLVEELLATCV
jgi:hypothetical protein